MPESSQPPEAPSALAAVTAALAKVYPGAFGFFYGSRCNGGATATSDVDLIVVFEDPCRSYREKFVFQGFLFDVFVYDAQSLHGAIAATSRHGQFGNINALLSATTLPHPTPLSLALTQAAALARTNGFKLPDTAFFRQYLSNAIDDLLGQPSRGEITMLAVDLYKTLVELVLIDAGHGVCNRKHASRLLSQVDPGLHRQLDGALGAAVGGDVAPIVALARTVLQRFGGELRAGFRMPMDGLPRLPIAS